MDTHEDKDILVIVQSWKNPEWGHVTAMLHLEKVDTFERSISLTSPVLADIAGPNPDISHLCCQQPETRTYNGGDPLWAVVQ